MARTRKREVLFVGLIIAAGLPSVAVGGSVTASSTDPRAIMEAVDDRDTGDRMTATSAMVVVDSAGRKRSLEFHSSAVNVKEKSVRVATKGMFQFISPADVRNTGLLSIAYDDASKEDPQWVFLPRLRKSKRIAGADRAGSWMGSDFSYSDLTRSDPSDFDFKLLQKAVNVDGKACWLIEAVPRTQRAKDDTGYVKTHWWISKEMLLPLQVKAWVRKGQKIKLFKFDQLKKIDGIWVAHRAAGRTLSGEKVESTTVVTTSNVKIRSASVSESSFTLAQMERGL